MPVSKLMIVDPGFAEMGVIRRVLCCGIEVVLCHTGTDAVSQVLGELVEVRDARGENFDVEDVDCILEFIDTEEKRIEFLTMKAIVGSKVPVLSRNIRLSLWDALRIRVHENVLSRTVSISLPSFYQRTPVFECVLHAGNSVDCRNSLRSLADSNIKLISYEDSEYEFYDKIGYFFATACIVGAYASGIDVEVADYIISSENTGVRLGTFAMLDRLGIDMFLEILGCRAKHDDMLRSMYRRLPRVVYDMVSDGLVGLGSRGGFYRTYDMLYGKVNQVIDIASGLYRVEKRDMYLQECLLDSNRCNEFVHFVWESFFSYVRHILDLHGSKCLTMIDEVLCTGYEWKYGVREIASRMGMDFHYKA